MFPCIISSLILSLVKELVIFRVLKNQDFVKKSPLKFFKTSKEWCLEGKYRCIRKEKYIYYYILKRYIQYIIMNKITYNLTAYQQHFKGTRWRIYKHS